MKFILALLVLISCGHLIARPINALHITFSEQCKKELEEVCQILGLNLTSWFVQELESLRGNGFWEGSSVANEIYNVGPRRAKRVWDKHKDFFNQFDVIITSDTVPLSRIFLQNGWTKPLIIWVCSRFDYAHARGGEDGFPDMAYYQLIRNATTMPNVRIVSYTPYERVYAQRNGIEFPDVCIKPIGIKIASGRSVIPSSIDKKETMFVYPNLLNAAQAYVTESCKSFGIKTYTGAYSGTLDLMDFKGVLYFPYQWSDVALFEGLQEGVIFFVPSKKFVLDNQHIIRAPALADLDLCEWYAHGNTSCIVYFDSWQDLKNKTMKDYSELKRLCIYVGNAHRNIMLSEWFTLFDELVLRKMV